MADNTKPNDNQHAKSKHLRYPANLGQPPVDKWILFEAKAGRHIVRRLPEKDEKDATVASCALYLTEGALKSGVEVAWEKSDLGPMIGSMIEAQGYRGEEIMDTILASTASELMTSALWKHLNLPSLPENWKELGGAIGDMANLGKEFAAASVVQHFGDPLAAVTGRRINPKTDVLFSSHDFRTHDFEFMLIPRNEDEAKTIDSIVRFFQFYMLPSFNPGKAAAAGHEKTKTSAFMIGFPYEFTINMYHGSTSLPMNRVNQIGRSVLKSFHVDHAAGGKVSFVKKGGTLYPAVTKLTLRFQEVRLLDREDDEVSRGQKNEFFDSKNS